MPRRRREAEALVCAYVLAGGAGGCVYNVQAARYPEDRVSSVRPPDLRRISNLVRSINHRTVILGLRGAGPEPEGDGERLRLSESGRIEIGASGRRRTIDTQCIA